MGHHPRSSGSEGPSSPARRVTILDIARASRVSKTTVSKVLNGAPGVATSTRSLVLRAADELGYQPNVAARSLRTRRSALVGLLAPTLDEPFGRIAEALDHALASQGIELVIACSRWRPENDIAALSRLRSRGVDAVVVSLSSDRDRGVGECVRSLGLPVVFLDREVDGFSSDAVITDQRPGMTQAIEHLVAVGRRSPGLVTMSSDTRPGREVKAAFSEASRAAGLTSADERILVADTLTREAGKLACRSLVAYGVDAIVVGPSMRLTAGVLDELAEQRIAVPDDLALVSFDENELASAKRPRLTVITRRIDEVGRLTGELAAERLASPDSPPRLDVVRTGLLIRESTATKQQEALPA